ncbi:MAG: riboflavin synthase [Gemmatimonadota bacterium]|nr:riboflavin synthase [Gemmatimonadota bacterium]
MFTGLVEAVGRVEERSPFAKGIRFRVAAPEFVQGLGDGESVAVDGVCHTIFDVDPEAGTFGFESIRTTLSRTTLGEFEPGRAVNLERAIRAGAPLGGHLVQGHVDGTGEMREVETAGETVFLRVRLPEEVRRLTVLYGSIAVDGISLTVNRLEGPVAEVAIIPYTFQHTNVARLGPGVRVNLEADMIGKYVDRLLAPYRSDGPDARGAEAGSRGNDDIVGE